LHKKVVDGRDKPGHDEKETRFQVVRKSLKILAPFSVRLSGRDIPQSWRASHQHLASS
jgi:hypothetical protein